jgi:hypothetical protein
LRELHPHTLGILASAAERCVGFITQQLADFVVIEIRQQGVDQVGVRQSVRMDGHRFCSGPE